MLPSTRQKTDLVRLTVCRNVFALAKSATAKGSEQGLTILECLVAVLITSIVIAAMSPPILIALATRVQNQRAEQAFELAQAEVDRVRLMVEQGNYTDSDLPPTIAPTPTGGIRNTDAPNRDLNSGSTDNRSDMTVTKGLRVDVNKDGVYDFVVQTFRDAGQQISGTDTRRITFQMGVRVYSYRAFGGSGTLEKEPAPLQLTSGERYQRQRPLSVLYTRITRSDLQESFCQYKKALDSTNTCS